ncbi:hypothetical protein SAMN05216419_10429 [Nitrosomonas cryotolerans]|uniref:Uncharacterized protein n=1 Tax=Nitrosomonas cryotolerans ATCC 49181 TaxID=1131553 RepID=A0A1N6F6G5_9PROT|nr:hypothetical protein [Nitrosomonas cryotolerans]SFP98673.1 hypothetical protein SAMN05216419_10429 [Nitrosomonas cryotolerans]SIN90847.1 hypothetical protein SAMN02743940_0113 [Nitrosomonas cryotolerans ATCC 49181]
MNDPNSLATPMKDAAWATIHTPLKMEALKVFCQDIERLLRINPMLHFKQWQILGAHHYRFSGKNLSQEQPFDFDLILNVKILPDGLQIHYQQGLKSSTTLIIEPLTTKDKWQSKLTIIDHYEGVPEHLRKQYLHQVDKSMVVWAEYLQRYLLAWKQWSCFWPWRWYMRYIWQPMSPSARRITYMLLWISGFEAALIALGIAIYYLEYS